MTLSLSKRAPLHRCHWPGCEVEVPPRLWGCCTHWFKLPRRIRDNIWKSYRNGQEEDKNPSFAYVQAVKAARKWIKDDEARPKGFGYSSEIVVCGGAARYGQPGRG